MRLSGSAQAADGTRLAFQVEGPRSGPPLLLLQGQANSHRWWRRLRGDFADQWLTITFDYRGTGATQADLDDGPAWTTAGFAADAAAVLTSLGQARADVYATSMGGRIAQELAIARPDLVDRLVLSCTSPGGHLARERGDDVRRALTDPDQAARHRATIDLFYSPDFVERCGGYDLVPTDLLGDPHSALAGRRHLAVSARHDASDRLAEITAPTLVMHGSTDRMTPSTNAEAIAAAITGAELDVVDGGRHGFFDELRDVVAPRVRAFLGQEPAGPVRVADASD
ncbi:alpha/beta hydrolase [Aeromicrobium alkaliterrae]|uniref:alpha/beta fold hydrolase n=1 Tax=Aeromicrobium alkaliterrae TaxID=302168 RepID=UPI0031DE8A8E